MIGTTSHIVNGVHRRLFPREKYIGSCTDCSEFNWKKSGITLLYHISAYYSALVVLSVLCFVPACTSFAFSGLRQPLSDRNDFVPDCEYSQEQHPWVVPVTRPLAGKTSLSIRCMCRRIPYSAAPHRLLSFCCISSTTTLLLLFSLYFTDIPRGLIPSLSHYLTPRNPHRVSNTPPAHVQTSSTKPLCKSAHT